MKKDRITAAFAAIVLVCVMVVGAFSASAAGGDQQDPLITLSYLTQVVKPELLEKVDEQVAANEKALTEKIDAAIDNYSKEMEQALTQGGVESSAFKGVWLEAGQTLKPAAGSEILLRMGGAKVSAGTSPVLLDSTTGGSLEIGGAVQMNHLYVAPLEAAGITADASGALFLVRGTFTVG